MNRPDREAAGARRLAVLGTGDLGSALAALFARHGHDVTLGSRDPRGARARLGALAALRVASYRAAAESAEVVCLAIPFDHHDAVLAALGDLTGKVLLDPSNPESADGRGLAIGHSTSGAERLAAKCPGVPVVKAFNYLYADLLRDAEALARVRPSIFLCGDDASAKRTIAALVESCALEPIDTGGLASARYLEPLAMLMVELVREQEWPAAATAFHLARWS